MSPTAACKRIGGDTGRCNLALIDLCNESACRRRVVLTVFHSSHLRHKLASVAPQSNALERTRARHESTPLQRSLGIGSVLWLLLLTIFALPAALASDKVILVSEFSDNSADPSSCQAHSNGVWLTGCNLRSALASPDAWKIMLPATETHLLNMDSFGPLTIAREAPNDIEIVPFRPNTAPTISAISSELAVFNVTGTLKLKVSNVKFDGCPRGAFYLQSSAWNASSFSALTLEDVIFTSNFGRMYGSAVYCEECVMVAKRTKFLNNTAVSRGGAIMVSFDAVYPVFRTNLSPSTLYGCTIDLIDLFEFYIY